MSKALEFDHTHSQFRRLLGFAKLARPRRDRADDPMSNMIR
jgi:hypothetical protein